ncbi:hypothetical protein CBG25_17055 [Arsenophonus sp. ENCA]|nr:hypothetical protein CBG25_17055 [Arsenophonus sp. ENCA]
MIPSYSLAQVFGISISEQRKIYFNHRNTLISLLSNTLNTRIDPYMPFVANIYHAGKEVPNISNIMESLLLKNNWHLADDLTVNFTYRDSRLEFGDIMPSRLGFVDVDRNMVPQWPLAQVHQKAGSASLKYQPLDSLWFDFYMSAWFNHTDASTNSAGGYPRAPINRDVNWDTATRSKYRKAIKDPTIDGRLINTANNSSENNRWGLDISNIFTLTPNLNLTLSSHFQNEKLINHADYAGVDIWLFQYPGREGRRQEYQLAFKFDWQPVEFLTFSAGANYVTYWSIDDLVNKKGIKKQKVMKIAATMLIIKSNIFGRIVNKIMTRIVNMIMTFKFIAVT